MAVAAASTSPTPGDRSHLPERSGGAVATADTKTDLTAGSVPTRLAVAFAVLAIVLEGASLVLYSAAAGFSARLSVPPVVLLESGASGARLIGLGSIIDMFGYLCMAPVVLYLRDRHAGARLINLYAIAGIALVVIGSIGAVVMSTAAPYLIDQYQSASPSGKQSIELVFGVLYRAVVVGMWQTLETIPFAAWLIGTAVAIRGTASRAVFWILLLIGLANAGIAIYRLSGL
jgi:hypothetical protein